ncbi:MAG: aquaporin, partial [Chthoniobacter sp.]
VAAALPLGVPKFVVSTISFSHLLPPDRIPADVMMILWSGGLYGLNSICKAILSQAAGAFAASALLRFLFPGHSTLGATLPSGTATQSFVLETVLTAMLMFVILGVSTGAKEKGITAGIAVGAVIGLEAMFAGPICGASMNPIRSLAPALVSGHLEHLWVYLLGPVLGALIAVPTCCLVRADDCCQPVSQTTDP